ncbi:MAG TPA: hypothetical protein VIN02_06670 [Sulfurovum sp.]
MEFIKGFLKSLMGILAPFILVFGGAGLVGLGIEWKINFLVWTGGITILIGLILGFFIYFSDGDFFSSKD